jgi:hypothetical protein
VAEHRFLVAGEHCGQPFPPSWHDRMANRERLPVKTVKPSTAEPSLDDSLPKPEGQQLAPPDDPVLPRCQPPQLPLPGCLRNLSHMDRLAFPSFRSHTGP